MPRVTGRAPNTQEMFKTSASLAPVDAIVGRQCPRLFQIIRAEFLYEQQHLLDLICIIACEMAMSRVVSKVGPRSDLLLNERPVGAGFADQCSMDR